MNFNDILPSRIIDNLRVENKELRKVIKKQNDVIEHLNYIIKLMAK